MSDQNKPIYLENRLALNLRPELALLDQCDTFWRELTAAVGVRILKEDRAPYVRAFLLAESSLLVWRDRIMLSTCGSGDLTALIPWLGDRFGEDAICASIYERPRFTPELAIERFEAGDGVLIDSWKPVRKSVLTNFSPRDLPIEIRRQLPTGEEVFQEHEFSPVGYSCNACRRNGYLTLHYSPEAEGSCLSLESSGFEASHELILEAGKRALSPGKIYSL